MSKPILIMQLQINAESSIRLNNYIKQCGIEKDYYVFIVITEGENKFQVFSDHEVEPIELDKLKAIISPSS